MIGIPMLSQFNTQWAACLLDTESMYLETV